MTDVKRLSVETKINGEDRTLHLVVKQSNDNFLIKLISRTNRMVYKEAMMYQKALK